MFSSITVAVVVGGQGLGTTNDNVTTIMSLYLVGVGGVNLRLQDPCTGQTLSLVRHALCHDGSHYFSMGFGRVATQE